MASPYEKELLRRAEAFKVKFAEKNPDHPELSYMDADIAARRQRIAVFDSAKQAVSSKPQAEAAAPVETPAKVTPQEQDRQLRVALMSYVAEYKAAEVHTPDLVNKTWGGIWKAIGERVGFEYQVPQSDRTTEELAQLKKEKKASLLLPDDIYTPDGLVRLGVAFPLMRSWSTKPEEAVRISHSSTHGGSLDIEMSHDAPYRTAKGYNEQELRDKIAADGRVGMRLPTYIVGSQFSKLLTGRYFDENTWSRTLESFYDDQALDAHFDSHGYVYVDSWYQSVQGSDLGGRSEGVELNFLTL